MSKQQQKQEQQQQQTAKATATATRTIEATATVGKKILYYEHKKETNSGKDKNNESDRENLNSTDKKQVITRVTISNNGSNQREEITPTEKFLEISNFGWQSG